LKSKEALKKYRIFTCKSQNSTRTCKRKASEKARFYIGKISFYTFFD